MPGDAVFRAGARLGVDDSAAGPGLSDALRLPWIAALALIALWLGGCTSITERRPPAAALLEHEPEAAYTRDGELLLQYRLDGRPVFLSAQWAADAAGGGHGYHTAILDPAPDAPAADPLQRDWEPVRRFDHAQWERLMDALLRDLVPAGDTRGTLVTLQGTDFVLHRDGGGTLRSYRLEHKPASLRVERRISEAEFAEAANAATRTLLAPDEAHAGPVLFPVAEDALGGAFVLFDFARNQSVFIVQPPSPLPAARRLGYTLRLVDALTLRSHAFSAVRHPVTLANRLVWLTTHSAAALVPRGAGSTDRTVPPLTMADEMDRDEWEARLDEIVGPVTYRGRMTPLIDGEAFFVALVQAIQDAQASVDVRLYIFDTDDYALRIADLLKARSREIRVRVLVDRLGTLAAGQVPRQSPYYSGRQPPLSIANYLRRDSRVAVRRADNPWFTSDHTKVIVVDGRRAFLGGMNIGREYRYEWHDLMVAVDGPIVGRLQKDFDKRWAHSGIGGDLAFFAASLRDEAFVGEEDAPDFIDIRPLYTRTGEPQILRAQIEAIRRAQSRIYIEQPYVSDDEVIVELIRARRRGVDVRVVLPTRSDSGFMNSANLLAARAFLANGVRVYGYPGMTHVKAALYDGWVTVGSANFDKLSLRINQETNVATSDPVFVERLRQDLFEADFAKSKEWTEAGPVGWGDYVAEFIADQL